MRRCRASNSHEAAGMKNSTLRVTATVALAAYILVWVAVAVVSLKEWRQERREAELRPPRVYHDPRRGITCLVFSVGVSCVADFNMPAR